MSKTIVSVSLLGPTFMDVIFREVASIATEKGMDVNEIQQEILSRETIEEVNEIFQKKLGGELKIRE